ncbi:MAG: universal stress protein [Anaerolineae bacterium]|jgi:nucleotide-binding universal stress UspA family protein
MPILVAIKGLSHAEAVLRLGAQIACRSHEPLTILTVVKHQATRSLGRVEAILAQASEVVQSQVSEARTKLRVGHPAVEIVEEAKEGHYDLVIVGQEPNQHLATRFLLGSTVIRVVEHAPCPVIVAKGKIKPMKRILLCDSGNADPSVGLPPDSPKKGPSALRRFIELPIGLIDGAGEIVVLHVMSQISAGPGVRGKQLRSDTEELLEERAPEGELLARDIEALAGLGLCARAKVRHGLVVEEILDEAQREDYDLVVIGAYRRQGWGRILLDDLAHKLVVELDRPVLVVR